MKVHTLAVGPIQANCYLVQEGTGGFVIDPGAEGWRILERCDEAGLVPDAILLTHGHFDHVSSTPKLLERWPEVPVYLHRGDWGLSDRRLYPLEHKLADAAQVRFYGDGDTLDLGDLTVKVLHTPGHSPGSVCLGCGMYLFTGDTLFHGSIGRTDLLGGDTGTMMASLTRLASLPDELRVLPGHGPGATLEWEKDNNPYLREAMAL